MSGFDVDDVDDEFLNLAGLGHNNKGTLRCEVIHHYAPISKRCVQETFVLILT